MVLGLLKPTKRKKSSRAVWSISFAEKKNKLIISESGISEPAHIKYLKNVGADAFLIGTGIMQSSNIKDKVKELVTAY